MLRGWPWCRQRRRSQGTRSEGPVVRVLGRGSHSRPFGAAPDWAEGQAVLGRRPRVVLQATGVLGTGQLPCCAVRSSGPRGHDGDRGAACSTSCVSAARPCGVPSDSAASSQQSGPEHQHARPPGGARAAPRGGGPRRAARRGSPGLALSRTRAPARPPRDLRPGCGSGRPGEGAHRLSYTRGPAGSHQSGRGVSRLQGWILPPGRSRRGHDPIRGPAHAHRKRPVR